MYRVVTYISDHQGNLKVDPGPWLASQSAADYWADFLRTIGYRVEIEKLQGNVTGNHSY